jgi:hypothetical protein
MAQTCNHAIWVLKRPAYLQNQAPDKRKNPFQEILKRILLKYSKTTN